MGHLVISLFGGTSVNLRKWEFGGVSCLAKFGLAVFLGLDEAEPAKWFSRKILPVFSSFSHTNIDALQDRAGSTKATSKQHSTFRKGSTLINSMGWRSGWMAGRKPFRSLDAPLAS